jgi:DNA polymerase I-like protein with 3'-5' exonuclease and polymerase domains
VPCEGHPLVIMHSTDADIDYLERILPGGFTIDDTMHKHAVLWSDFEHTLDFLGSIYGRTNRWKHLDRTSPLVYSGADALGTWDVDRTLDAEFARDPRSEWIYRNLQLPQVHVIRRANRVGLRVNQAHVPVALEELEARCEDSEAQMQAAVGWPINIASGPQVMHQLYTVEQVHSRARHRGKA